MRPGAVLAVPALEAAGIRAVFTTRSGGAGEGALASLNLAHTAGEVPDRVYLNRRRVLDAVGAPLSAWTSGRQIHGAEVGEAIESDRGAGLEGPETSIPGVDALWTAKPGIALAVLVADCLPILLAEPDRRRVATIHAGWRGLSAGIVGRTVDALGSDASALLAYVGPAIGPCCYEVGEEVAVAVEEAVGDSRSVRREDGRIWVDLWSAAAAALRLAGVRQLRFAGLCTRSEPHRFFSHRGGSTGRQGLVAMMS